MILSIREPFVKSDELDARMSWAINTLQSHDL
jgi:hypothetical protein